VHLSYCHLFGGQTVRVEQRPVVDCLDRDSMAEGILFDTSVRGLLEEDVSGKGQMGVGIWGTKRTV